MRPHILTMHSLGAFGGEACVDFDQLSPFGLFHIHGSTGAGKTSIIDGLCFALYGQVPKPRSAHRLRSDHAPPTAVASASLDFTAQNSDWRIVREPNQTRTKLRGGGTTTHLRRDHLYRRNGNGWSIVAEKKAEVDPLVTNLVGLNAEQFMQVVVLPQGAFQQVLQADSIKRGELLATLFGTERFRLFGEHLKQKALVLEGRVRLHKSNIEQLMQRARESVEQLDISAVVENGDESELVRRLTTKAAEVLVEATDSVNQNELAVKQLREQRQRLAVQKERRDRKIQALNQREGLEAAQSTVDKLSERLSGAEAAAPLISVLEHHEDSTQQLTESEAHRATVQRSLAASADVLSEIHAPLRDRLTRLDTLETLGFDEIHSWQQQAKDAADKMHKATNLVAETLDLKISMDASADASTAIVQDIEAAQKHSSQLQAEIESVDAQLKVAESESKDPENLYASADAYRSQIEAARLFVDATQECAELEKLELAKSSQANKTKEDHLLLLQRRLDGMAGELAGKLASGEPCVVCGSEQHPSPAQASVGAVDVQEIEAAKKRADEAFGSHQQVTTDVRSAIEKRERLRSEAGEAASDPDKIQAKRQALLQQIEDAKSSNARKIRLTNLREQLGNDADVADDRLNQLFKNVTRHEAELDSLRYRFDAISTRLKESIGDVDPINEASILDTISEKLHLLESRCSELGTAKKNAAKAESRLAAALIDCPFDTAAKVREQYLENADIQEIRERITEHRERVAANEHVLKELDEVDIDQAVDKLDDVNARLEALEAVLKQVIARRTIVSDRHHELVRLGERIAVEDSALQPIKAVFERTHFLADICTGGRNNEKRMSLERYVLAAYLEEVARAATTRLHSMTSGRYSLVHTDEKLGTGPSGLDLRVVDSHTGARRLVSSLSGGETFLASLALALGLADVVQQHAGGIHIDTLFIDEGFGSLDSDTLELAMTELDRLREGGRLIGVISHVPALRERIATGLAVVPGEQGSKIVLTGAAAASAVAS